MEDVKISGRSGCGCVITTAATAMRSPFQRVRKAVAERTLPIPDRNKVIKIAVLPLFVVRFAEALRFWQFGFDRDSRSRSRKIAGAIDEIRRFIYNARDTGHTGITGQSMRELKFYDAWLDRQMQNVTTQMRIASLNYMQVMVADPDENYIRSASYAELLRVVSSVVIEMCGHIAVDDFGFPPLQAGKVFPRGALMQIYDVCAEFLYRPMTPNDVTSQRRAFYERAYAESAKAFIRTLKTVRFPETKEGKACALCRWYGGGSDDPCRFHFAKAAPLASCRRFKTFNDK